MIKIKKDKKIKTRKGCTKTIFTKICEGARALEQKELIITFNMCEVTNQNETNIESRINRKRKTPL
jgi:hypothetical protein